MHDESLGSLNLSHLGLTSVLRDVNGSVIILP